MYQTLINNLLGATAPLEDFINGAGNPNPSSPSQLALLNFLQTTFAQTLNMAAANLDVPQS